MSSLKTSVIDNVKVIKVMKLLMMIERNDE